MCLTVLDLICRNGNFWGTLLLGGLANFEKVHSCPSAFRFCNVSQRLRAQCNCLGVISRHRSQRNSASGVEAIDETNTLVSQIGGPVDPVWTARPCGSRFPSLSNSPTVEPATKLGLQQYSQGPTCAVPPIHTARSVTLT